MKVFVKYDINIKQKIYTNLELDSQFYFKKYNSASYIYDRNNGPAYLKYKNNKLTYETYRINDKLHRPDGSAKIDYEINEFEYWIDGEQYNSEFEYWIAVGNYKSFKRLLK